MAGIIRMNKIIIILWATAMIVSILYAVIAYKELKITTDAIMYFTSGIACGKALI